MAVSVRKLGIADDGAREWNARKRRSWRFVASQKSSVTRGHWAARLDATATAGIGLPADRPPNAVHGAAGLRETAVRRAVAPSPEPAVRWRHRNLFPALVIVGSLLNMVPPHVARCRVAGLEFTEGPAIAGLAIEQAAATRYG